MAFAPLSGQTGLRGIETALESTIPGGSAASQNDVLVLAESTPGLVLITVEGKVSEPFRTAQKLVKNKHLSDPIPPF